MYLKRGEELSNPKWQDKDGKDTSKGLAGETLKLCVDCNADMEEGAGVIFSIYDSTKLQVGEVSGENKGGKAEAEWIYRYKHDPEEPLTEKPKFMFKAKALHTEKVESGTVEMETALNIPVLLVNDEPVTDMEYILIDSQNKEIKGKTADDGHIKQEGLIPGLYTLSLLFPEEQGMSIIQERSEKINEEIVSTSTVMAEGEDKMTIIAGGPLQYCIKVERPSSRFSS